MKPPEMNSETSSRKILLAAAILGFFAVGLGAFGSHALKDILLDKGVQQWEIASRYHFFHALALLGVGLLAKQIGFNRFVLIVARLMVLGIFLFSGSLYLFAITKVKWMALFTPIGGLLLLAAWALLAYLIYHLKTDAKP